ncbi:MAG: Rpn family recombination-promoting nuclease/putative transposase [Prevotellaceae bacterium]|jgi:predicted transposase/invertase (TIGR01784 family)|nr:Rpn family recombination-promoting nuclease/putative transposase [Prevotellaceae bacterium]
MTTHKNKARQLVSFDWAIKRLLRSKANYEVIEGFLSELLMRPIKITGIMESESNKESATDKSNKVDVKVEDDKGEIILIEIQFILQIDYFQRMLYGVSNTIKEQMIQGDQYMKIRKVYSINIVYFDLGQRKDYIYCGQTTFKGLHKKDILKLADDQKKMFNKIKAGDLFPEYYVLKINKFDDVAKDTLDEWIYFLKHDRIEDGFKAKGLLKAREVLDYNRLTPEQKAEYDRDQMAKSDRLSEIASGLQAVETKVEMKYAKKIEKQSEKLKEKDKTIKEKDKTIEEKDKEIAELNRRLNI